MKPSEKGSACLFLIQLFILMILSLSYSALLGAEEKRELYIDERLQMDLADHLFKEGDYYRAITEYKRFLFFFPQSRRAEEAQWKIAQSYFNGGKWDEVIAACDDLVKTNPDSPQAAEAFLLQGRCFAEKKEYSQARFFFRKAREKSLISPLVDEAQRQIALTYVKEEKWSEAASEFSKINKDSELYPKATYFAQGLERIQEVPRKSPETAGFLAAILPGAGHLYCERYRDAAMAFLLNGAFICGMVEAFQQKSYVVGGILTFFELGWYSGNIYSAVNSVHKYNRGKRQEFLDSLERGSNASLGFFLQGKTPILSFSYAF